VRFALTPTLEGNERMSDFRPSNDIRRQASWLPHCKVTSKHKAMNTIYGEEAFALILNDAVFSAGDAHKPAK
jgi:hypothetical protein